MDTTVSTIANAVARSMRASGYMESTIAQYMKGLRYLEDFCRGEPYRPELGAAYVDARKPDGRPYSRNYVGHKRKVVHLCDTYTEHDIVDLSAISYAPTQPMPSSPSLLATLALYDAYNEERGLARSTCGYYGRLAREYALFLEGAGITCIEDADAASVLGFMATMAAKWTCSTTYHIATNFMPFLKWVGKSNLVDAIALAHPTREHRIVPMLTDEDEEAVAKICCNGSVPAGDGAITLLALTTGMRACDIVNLEISDIDWRTSTISIMQQKTGNPLTVPMRPMLAEALGRYLLEERPESNSSNVFVRQKAPHVPFAGHSAIYAATRRTFLAAGVAGGGTRLLRHNAASRMLRFGTPLPTIASVLGHADPDSTNVYMEADAESMAACVLALPRGCA